jgi:endoglucanase
MGFARGVNLAGAEFGEKAIPGVLGTNFTYNSEDSFRYFAGLGLWLIRLPVLWERLQPALERPLDPQHLSLVKQNVDWARRYGARVIVDIQNFGRYRDFVIDNRYGGEVKVSRAHLADLWVRLSNEFKSDPAVYAYDLMNEPHDMGTADWKVISQGVLMDIRATGDDKLIMVPGDNWSAAQTWPRVHGPAGWIADPAHNFCYEAHQYFDHDNSGSYKLSYEEEGAAPDTGQLRLAPFVAWCRENQVRGYLGEYGVPDNDPRWLAVLDNFLRDLDAAGFDGTYWAAGEWWGAYPLSVQPQANAAERPQLAVLVAHPGDPPLFPDQPAAPDWPTGFGSGLGIAD